MSRRSPSHSTTLSDPSSLTRTTSMTHLKHILALTLPASLFPLPALFAQKRAITVDDYLALRNVGDPQVSPDWKWVVYAVGTISLQDNKSASRLWLANVATGAAREL